MSPPRRSTGDVRPVLQPRVIPRSAVWHGAAGAGTYHAARASDRLPDASRFRDAPGEASGVVAHERDAAVQPNRHVLPLALATVVCLSMMSFGFASAAHADAPPHLVFVQQPSDSTGGVPFATQPVVAIEDSLGNTLPDSSAVRLVIVGGGNSMLHCNRGRAVDAVAGVATFAHCRIGAPGTYRLLASGAGFTSAASDAVTIAVGPAAQLAFTTQPGNETLPGNFDPQPVVVIQDAGGNVVTDATSTVRLVIRSGGVGILSCTHGRKAVAVFGIATFAGCHIAVAGSYVLRAVADGLVPAESGMVGVNP